jgi:hypothetical protein
MEWIPADTTIEAALVQFEICRRMTPERRFEMACEMSDSLRRLATEGVRHRHPEYTEDQVRLASNRLWLGDELFRQVFPGVRIEV